MQSRTAEQIPKAEKGDCFRAHVCFRRIPSGERDPDMIQSFVIEPMAYQIIGEDERSLSAAARNALHSAVPSGSVLKATCSRAAAEEIRDWFNRVATGHLYIEGIHWKSEVCRKAEKVIRTTLLLSAGTRKAYVSELRQ